MSDCPICLMPTLEGLMCPNCRTAYEKGKKEGAKEALEQKHLALIPEGCKIVSEKFIEDKKKEGARNELEKIIEYEKSLKNVQLEVRFWKVLQMIGNELEKLKELEVKAP